MGQAQEWRKLQKQLGNKSVVFGWEILQYRTFCIWLGLCCLQRSSCPSPCFKFCSRAKLLPFWGGCNVKDYYGNPPWTAQYSSTAMLWHSRQHSQDEMLPAALPSLGSGSGSFQPHCVYAQVGINSQRCCAVLCRSGRNTGKTPGVWQSSLAPAEILTSCWVWKAPQSTNPAQVSATDVKSFCFLITINANLSVSSGFVVYNNV